VLDFFFSDLNLPYTLALTLVVAIALLEGIVFLIGFSFSSLLDELFSIDIEVEPRSFSFSLSSILGWLHYHRLPFLVWSILLLCSFGVVGSILNFIFVIPLFVSLPISFVCTIFITRYLAESIVKIIPKNESSAISLSSFSGQVATITIGKASKGNAAEAVFHDQFNQKHYVLVEPECKEQIFEQGKQVILVEKLTNSWLAIELFDTKSNPDTSL